MSDFAGSEQLGHDGLDSQFAGVVKGLLAEAERSRIAFERDLERHLRERAGEFVAYSDGELVGAHLELRKLHELVRGKGFEVRRTFIARAERTALRHMLP